MALMAHNTGDNAATERETRERERVDGSTWTGVEPCAVSVVKITSDPLPPMSTLRDNSLQKTALHKFSSDVVNEMTGR